MKLKYCLKNRLLIFVPLILLLISSCSSLTKTILEKITNDQNSSKKEISSSDEKIFNLDKKEKPNAMEYFTRGKKQIDENNFENAIESFEKAIKINPYNERYFFWSGLAKAKIGRTSDAINDFSKAISLDDTNSRIFNQRGALLANQKKYKLAIKDFNKAISIDPNNPDSHYNLGSSLFYIDEAEQAIISLSKAIDLNSSESLYYFNRGYAYVKLDNYHKALEDFLKVELYDPNHQEISKQNLYYWIGLTKILTGKVEEGCIYLNDSGSQDIPEYCF